MILVDTSSIIHRKVHSSISTLQPNKINGVYVTSEFIPFTLHLILEELFNIHTEFNCKYGEMILCLDNATRHYWRKDVYHEYKSNRKDAKEESDINFSEVFQHVNELLEMLRNYSPWKVVDVERAEADDLMLVLAKEFNSRELILIHSPDKDMIQAQRNTNNVHQYSALTKKWIIPEHKHDNMDHWITEHVCLGDSSDGVPRVVDHTEFSQNFIDYLKINNIPYLTPYEFKKEFHDNDKKRELLEHYPIYKTNKKGEPTVLDVYKDIRFGSSTLQKNIDKFGSIDNWLDSHPLYREHYERNFKLVMEEGIPDYIWNEIIIKYKLAETEYDEEKFKEYLNNKRLSRITLELPNVFKSKTGLTAENCGW